MKFVVRMKLENSEMDHIIAVCKNHNHFQQVVYSVHGSCLTQVCFDCMQVNTSLD